MESSSPTDIASHLRAIFATGRWTAGVEDLDKALVCFADENMSARCGNSGFTFHLVRGHWHKTLKRLNGYWMIGHSSFDTATLRTGTPTKPDPSFEGWPYAQVDARNAPGGLIVKVWHNTAYAESIREYLGPLVEALTRDGLSIEAAPIAIAEFSHSTDYRSCTFRGETFIFSKRQSQIVEQVHKNPNGIGQEAVAEALDLGDKSKNFKIRDYFRKKDGSMHEAWGSMLCPWGEGMIGLGQGPSSRSSASKKRLSPP